MIMVQVENETGLFESRDHGPEASAAFAAEVPPALIDHLVANKGHLAPHLEALWQRNGRKQRGTWAEVFGTGKDGDEIFMAWRYASYIGDIAASGKAAYDLPLYVNAWLASGEPGTFPSGGPNHRVIDVWKAAAPAISICAPDIYSNDFKGVTAAYHRRDNPLVHPGDPCRRLVQARACRPASGRPQCVLGGRPSRSDLLLAVRPRGPGSGRPHRDESQARLRTQPVDPPVPGSGRMEGILQAEAPKAPPRNWKASRRLPGRSPASTSPLAATWLT